MLKSEKECIEYTISMFSSDPYGFCDNVNEVEIQYLSLKQLSKKHNIDFDENMCLYNNGKKLYESIEMKNQLNQVNKVLTDINKNIDINDNELNEALKSLDKSIKEFEYNLKILKKTNGDLNQTSGMMQNKNYVDGLIKNLKNASIEQLTTLINNVNILHGPFKPNYYSDEYLLKLLEKNLLYNKRRIVYEKLK
jgi:exonuclease VII small subunit